MGYATPRVSPIVVEAGGGGPQIPVAMRSTRSAAQNKAMFDQALAVLPEEGGTLLLPPGEFAVDPLTIDRAHVQVIGSGMDATVLNKSDPDEYGLSVPGEFGSSLQAVVLQGFTLKGDGTGSGGGLYTEVAPFMQLRDLRIMEHGGNGWDAVDQFILQAQGVRLEYNGGHGVAGGSSFNAVILQDCHLQNNGGHGLYLGGGWRTVQVIGGTNEKNLGDGIHVGEAGFGLLIQGSYFEYLGDGADNAMIAFHASASGATVVGNYFNPDDLNGTGLADAAVYVAPGVTVRGQVVGNHGRGKSYLINHQGQGHALLAIGSHQNAPIRFGSTDTSGSQSGTIRFHGDNVVPGSGNPLVVFDALGDSKAFSARRQGTELLGFDGTWVFAHRLKMTTGVSEATFGDTPGANDRGKVVFLQSGNRDRLYAAVQDSAGALKWVDLVTRKLKNTSYGLPEHTQVENVASASLPSPTANHRGTVIVVQGGTGAADKPLVCLKKDDESYGWFNLATAAFE